MIVSKHAHARFKQRFNIKNPREMMRRFALAISRGTLLPGESSQPDTLCYFFNGGRYIVSADKTTLITVFPDRETVNRENQRQTAIKELNRLFAELPAYA